MEAEIDSKALPILLNSLEFRTRLGEIWRLSYENGREHGLAAFLCEEYEFRFSDVIRGRESELNMKIADLYFEGLGKKGLFYFFMHSHPEDHTRKTDKPLIPTPSDLDALSIVRIFYKKMGVSIRPVHAIVNVPPYADQKTLNMVLYQEATEKPIFENEESANTASSTVKFIFSLPKQIPTKYEIDLGEFIDVPGFLDNHARVKMLDSSPFFNVREVFYHRDKKVENGIPYTSPLSPKRFEVFSHKIVFDPEKIENS